MSDFIQRKQHREVIAHSSSHSFINDRSQQCAEVQFLQVVQYKRKTDPALISTTNSALVKD